MSEPVVSGIRIVVELDPADEQGIDTEMLWTERVSADTFRLNNSPFFAFELSAGDVVRAEKVEGMWHFREVVEQGGHSTYRIYLAGERNLTDDDVQAAWKPIEALGATYENANDRFFAVDVPPAADLDAIYDLFEKGEADGVWEFEEANYESDEDDAATEEAGQE